MGTIAGKDLKLRLVKGADLKFEDVYVPEWDATVRVRALTAREMLARSEAMNDPARSREDIFAIVAAAVVTEDGEAILDVETVAARPFDIVNRIATVSLRLSGLTEKGPAKDPSPAAPGADSRSS